MSYPYHRLPYNGFPRQMYQWTRRTPSDIRVGWRSVAVKAARVEAVSYVFCDIIEEEVGEEVDTMVGISINGIPFAQAIAGQMDLELAVSH